MFVLIGVFKLFGMDPGTGITGIVISGEMLAYMTAGISLMVAGYHHK
jgi:hypothetical protein